MFALKTTIGFLVRAILLAPFVIGLFYAGEYTSYVNNVSTFLLVILGLASLLYLVVSTIIPAEYAIKTDIKVLEYNMWLPQVIMVNVMGVVALVLCMAMASQAMYVSAVILFFYALAHFLWPRYIKRIDAASKNHMMETLKTS